MRTAPRRHLSHASLVLLLAADVLALTALLLNQWLEAPVLVLWGFAAGLTLAAMPWLVRLVDKVFVLARSYRNVPLAGESFP